MSTDASGRLTAGGAHAPRAAVEELRLALVLNGGVSLAVWMGGATLEIDRLTKGEGCWATVLGWVRSRARVDVVTGTSAGGINGAAIALTQTNRNADLRLLRDLWAEQGSLQELLRTPFAGAPPSLLQGDEYFLPRLGDAFESLAARFERHPSDIPAHEPGLLDHPLYLQITTTLLHGAMTHTVDSLGQRLPQTVHDGRFSFTHDPDGTVRELRRLPYRSPGGEGSPECEFREDDFTEQTVAATARRLALAARSTASFPIAFEPSFVPVGAPPGQVPDDGRHPDMAASASWASANGDGDVVDRSRFVVDGGLLANTPTRPALKAIDRMPADGPTRRVMLLVYPHAPLDLEDAAEPADRDGDPPTVAGTATAMLGALSAQGSRTFVEEVMAHNRTAASRRGSRRDVLASLHAENGRPEPPAQRLRALAYELEPHFAALRMRRTAASLAGEIPAMAEWSFERARVTAEAAQRTWWRRHGSLPYVPARRADADAARPLAPDGCWPWGDSTARGLVTSVLHLVRLVAAVAPESDAAPLAALRRDLHESRTDLRRLREVLDRPWVDEDGPFRGQPPDRLWTRRLEAFSYLVCGDAHALDGWGPDLAHARDLVEHQVPPQRLRLRGAATPPEAVPGPGSFGRRIRWIVQDAVRGFAVALDLARRLPAEVREQADLEPWLALFGDCLPALDAAGDPPAGPGAAPDPATDRATDPAAEELLARLLDLEIATFCLADSFEDEETVGLVQLSLQTSNAFATVSRDADDKAAGMAVNRFSGFLKRSWRINDWMWGRMDAATTLTRVVLTPERLRRVALVERPPDPGATPQLRRELAARWLEDLVGDLFEGTEPDHPAYAQARRLAQKELEQVLDLSVGLEELPPLAPGIAAVAAWGLHVTQILEDLPVLQEAVYRDRVAGADRRSNGEVLLAVHDDLLRRVAERNRMRGSGAEPRRVPHGDVALGVEALEAFDRAGVGREPLRQESTSDSMIRTAATAAGVAVTMLDGRRSGLRPLRPITRVLRGAVLLPYWAVRGLTSGNTSARMLGLVSIPVGALLLLAAVTGVGPVALEAAIGAGALLTGFGYAALRTGALLHGLVLLSPTAPLVAWAVNRPPRGGDAADAGQRGGWVLACWGAVLVGLLVLGSLPSPLRSPIGVARSLVDADRLRPFLLRAAAVLAAVGAAVAAAWAVYTALPHAAARWPRELGGDGDGTQGWTGPAVAAAVLLAGALLALWNGRRLQRYVVVRGSGWRPEPVSEPSGVTAGWAVVYGAGYLGVAFLVWLGPGGLAGMDGAWPVWRRVTLTMCLLVGLTLVTAYPSWVVWRRTSAIRERLLVSAPRGDEQAFLRHLRDRGLTYRFLVRPARPGDAVRVSDRADPVPRPDGTSVPDGRGPEWFLALRPAARRLARAVQEPLVIQLPDGPVAPEAASPGRTEVPAGRR